MSRGFGGGGGYGGYGGYGGGDDEDTAVARGTDGGFLEGLKHGTLSGLGYVGSVLGKPGRASRAALDTLFGSGRHSRDILAALPFSDTLGWTRPSEEIGGAELTKNITGYDPSKGSWAARNLLPFAVETLTDPLTFTGGPLALTKAGRAAEKVGALERGLVPAIRAGQRSLVPGLTGPRIAGALEAGGNVLRRLPGAPAVEEGLGRAGTRLRSIFDVESGPVAQRAIQESHRGFARPFEKAAARAARGEFYDLAPRRAALAKQVGEEPLETFLRGKVANQVLDPALEASMPAEAHQLAADIRRVGWEAPAQTAQERGLAGTIGEAERTPRAGEDILTAAREQAIRAGRKTGRAEAVFDVLGKHALPGAGPIPEGQDVLGVLQRAGMGGEAGIRRAAESLGIDRSTVGRDLFGHPILEDLTRQLSRHQLPADIAGGIGNLMKPRPAGPPGPLGQLAEAAAPYLRGFKRGVYSVWPGSHVKNLFGGRVQAFLETGIRPVGGAYGDANKVMRNIGIDSKIADLAHLAPELQSQELKREAFRLGLIGQEAGPLGDETLKDAGRIVANPARASDTLAKIGKDFIKDMTTGAWRNPLGSQGAAVKMGGALNQAIEDNLRLGEFIGLRQRGWTADAAAQKVFQTHFNYGGGMSEAEQRLWGGIATFPTFTRFNVPKQIGRAVTHPGQALALLRASENLNRSGQEVHIPGYHQGQLSFPTPLGGLSGLGLQVEDLGNLNLGRFAGMLRPGLALPIALATGVDPRTGQPLSEKPPSAISRTLGWPRPWATTLDEFMGALPTSRIAGTISGVASPSSWERGIGAGARERLLPLATGAKIQSQTPEDIERFRTWDRRRAAESVVGASPYARSYTETYIPREDRSQIDENTRAAIQYLKQLNKAERRRKKQRQLSASAE